MNKSKLRKEYEARMGVVEDTLQLFDADGNNLYEENSLGWSHMKYNAEGEYVYYKNSLGDVIDHRPIYIATIVADQDGKHYELLEVIK